MKKEKKVVIPLKPKKSKIVKVNIERIISGTKFKTKQVNVKEYLRNIDEKVRKHKRTVRKK